jgi:hypothetical protein
MTVLICVHGSRSEHPIQESRITSVRQGYRSLGDTARVFAAALRLAAAARLRKRVSTAALAKDSHKCRYGAAPALRERERRLRPHGPTRRPRRAGRPGRHSAPESGRSGVLGLPPGSSFPCGASFPRSPLPLASWLSRLRSRAPARCRVAGAGRLREADHRRNTTAARRRRGGYLLARGAAACLASRRSLDLLYALTLLSQQHLHPRSS